MALETLSKFYYGHNVTTSNNKLGFDEGSGELTAEISVGEYTLTEYADEIATALNTAGNLEYTTSLDRETRKITISAGSNFSLLVNSSSTSSSSTFSLAGFTGSDLSGSSSYEGDSSSGSEYKPQFWLENYIPKENDARRIGSSRNESSSGKVQVFSYGLVRFVTFNIIFITDINQGDNGAIETDLSGESNANDFMEYCTAARPIEFMPDRDNTSDFVKLLIERTPQSEDGTAYKLREMLNRGLSGYYQTGRLVWREQD